MSAEQILIIPEALCFRLRSINERDIEDLRVWKNSFRDRFFHKALISPEEQVAWYKGFVSRPDDFMFMAEATCVSPVEPFGCVGFRIVEDVVDIYNLIRGKRLEGQRCSMLDALSLVCSHASTWRKPITFKVVKHNPVIPGYEEHHFVKVEEKPEYYVMKLREDLFVPAPYRMEVIRDLGLRL